MFAKLLLVDGLGVAMWLLGCHKAVAKDDSCWPFSWVFLGSC